MPRDRDTAGKNEQSPDLQNRNQRQYFRIDAEVPIAIRLLPERKRGCLGCYIHLRNVRQHLPDSMKEVNVNISEGGLYLVWDRPFVLGDYVEVKMLLHHAQDELVVLCGEVVRSQHVRGDLFGVALKFPCRYDVMKRIINRFVMHKERENRARKIIGNL